MLIEYTPNQLQKLKEIEKHYGEQLAAKYKELGKHGEKTKIYARLTSEVVALEDERLSAYADTYEEFERAHMEELGGDVEKIVADAKEQVARIIENQYNGLSEYDLVYDPATITVDENGIPHGELIPRKGKEKPLIEAVDALRMINRGLHLHFEALKDSGQPLKALRDYIYNYIRTSPYTYTDTHKAEPATEDEKAALRRPLEPLSNYGLMNDKVNAQLISFEGTNQPINGQMRIVWGIDQAGKNSTQQVPTYVALQYEGTQTHLTKRMTAFDNAVYNAISTRYFYHKLINGNEPFYITPQEIWRTMNGAGDTNKAPGAKQVQRVCASMDKMRFTRFYMDISGELQAHYITLDDERVTKGQIDTYMLESDKVTFTTEKGREITGYKVKAEPILYTYNAAKDHILYVSYNLLDTSNKTGNEGNTIEYRNYLLQQIQLMYNGIRDSTRILYDTLYRDTGIGEPAARISADQYKSEATYKSHIRQEAKKDREKVAAILESWKEKEYIKGFTPVMKGQSYIGVEIQLNPKTKKKPK